VPSDLEPRQQPRWADDLGNQRKRLLDAWNDDTIHPSYLTTQVAAATKSRGQCGVTSAWLIGALGKQYPDLELAYCYGGVWSLEHEVEVLPWHCWVEVGRADDPGRYVVDLTGDQLDLLEKHPVLCEPHDVVRASLGLDYRVAPDKRMDAEALALDPVNDRLKVLTDLMRTKR
jgi:hypothetical protein